jgi:hypothetical protein
MIKLALVPGLIALVGILSVYATPASAEFSSKSTEGKDGNSQIVLEGIGGTLDCGTGETNATWEIEKENKPAEKGPDLLLKFKLWGTCQLEYKEGTETKETSATGGECDWETQETGSERAVKDTIVSPCTLKATISSLPCEIKVAPESNKERSELLLIDSGEEDENLLTELDVKNLTVGATGTGCLAAGIKSTTTGSIKGDIESQQVAPAVAAPVFRMSYVTSNQIIGINLSRTVNVTNRATAGAPGMKLLEAGESPWFTVANETLATCQGRNLNTNAACPMKVTFSMASNRIRRVLFQIWEGGVVTSEVAILAIS